MHNSDFNIKSIEHGLESDNNDEREAAALSGLIDIRKKVEEIGDPPYAFSNNPKSNLNQSYFQSPYCSICLPSIQGEDIAYRMNCCNCFFYNAYRIFLNPTFQIKGAIIQTVTKRFQMNY